jgi:phosphoglycolate phosphatase-like HAD superfamily hydrolase
VPLHAAQGEHALMDESPRSLVLWDIDQTLLNAGGVSEEIYADAFRRAVGRPMERLAELAGRTERAITVETLRMHDIEVSAELLDAFGVSLADTFVSYEEAIRRRGRALPGAREALQALSARKELVQSVLTGNMEPIAVGKLAAFGLHHFMDFEVGAYGMEHEARPPLVLLAQARAARKYGQAFTAANTVLIGDTADDVQAGYLGGARVIAVATGSTGPAALRAAGAELVLDDLVDTGVVVDAILAGSRRCPTSSTRDRTE